VFVTASGRREGGRPGLVSFDSLVGCIIVMRMRAGRRNAARPSTQRMRGSWKKLRAAFRQMARAGPMAIRSCCLCGRAAVSQARRLAAPIPGPLPDDPTAGGRDLQSTRCAVRAGSG
jgi:hypothetical protein